MKQSQGVQYTIYWLKRMHFLQTSIYLIAVIFTLWQKQMQNNLIPLECVLSLQCNYQQEIFFKKQSEIL